MTAAETRSADLQSWESWLNRFFSWVPYVLLAIALLIGQAGERDIPAIALACGAAVWTWMTYNRLRPRLQAPPTGMGVYFIGFVVFALALVSRQTVFLVYGITGFFHAFLLRPLWASYVGIGAAGLIVHSHIVFTDSSVTAWVIYAGVVVLQTAAVGAGVYGGLKLTELAEERRRTVNRLKATLAENAGLHAQLVAQAHEAGVLDERQRMAREIHDTIAQGLTGVITQLEAAHQAWGDDGEVTRHLDLAGGIARESLDEARRSVQAIRPGPLDHSRLPEALDEIAAKWAAAADIGVQMQTTGERRPLHPDVEVTLLRAAQEALANVAKHSSATRVGITLSFMDGAVVLDVRDDGVGFKPEEPVGESSFGLAGMRQRVEDAKGRMEIESAPGEGSAISITLTTGVQSDDR